MNDHFRGVRYSEVGELPAGTVTSQFPDGTGSKPEIVRIAENYSTIYIDLAEASGADAACRGYEPVHLVSYLKVNTLGQDEERLAIIRELAEGSVEASARFGISISNGELAQDNTMGQLGQFRFELFGVMVGYGHESRLVDGSQIKPGEPLVGFYESGFRNNGYSLLRDVWEYYYGPGWGEEFFMGQRLVDHALRPSEVYTPALVDMTGGYDLNRPALATLNGATNISGGGIPEKLGSLLKSSGCGAIIDNPFPPPEAMALVQTLGMVPDKEAYSTLCMGNGLILATQEPDRVIEIGRKHGLIGRKVGQTTSSGGHIAVRSRGSEHPGRWLNYFM